MILRTMRITMCALATVLGAAAPLPAGGDPSRPAKITEITLSRSSGAGAGPEDVLTLRSDGTAAYVGTKNVEHLGTYAGAIPRHGFDDAFPLLAAQYESIHAQPGSTGKPTSGVTSIHWRVVRDGKAEELEDLCPGLDPRLWAFEMACRGVAADIAWTKAQEPGARTPAGADAAGPPALKLAPSADAPKEETLNALAAHPWVLAGPINILGEGWTQTLRFTRQREGGVKAEEVFHRTPGFSDRRPAPADRTETDACEIRGPVLFRGGRPQTFALVTNAKSSSLVLNALSPAGDLRWYYAACDRDKEAKGARVEEYLFEFAADPLKQDAGEGKVSVRVGDYPPKTRPVRFALTKTWDGMRYVRIETDGPNGPAQVSGIALAADGQYGLMLDNTNLNSKTFSAAGDDQAR